MGRSAAAALHVLRVGLVSETADDSAGTFPQDAVVRDAATLDDALPLPDPAAFPDLVVVRRDDPVRPARSTLERFVEAAPLARIVALDGPWCASDGRTRDAWPGALRTPAECAAARMRRELAVLAGRVAPLPLAASREEVFEWHAEPVPEARAADLTTEPPASCGRIEVRSPDRAWAEEFADRLRRLLCGADDLRGATVSFAAFDDGPNRGTPGRDADLVLCDVDPWRAAIRVALTDLRAAVPRAALAAISGWILPELEDACRADGCDAVWSKLADPDDLVHATRALLIPRRSVAS